MKTFHFAATFSLGLTLSTVVQAQLPGTSQVPRTDDHFQRRAVVSRIDLDEKMNKPIGEVLDLTIYANPEYQNNQGIVAALINGLRDGRYLAYNPDNLRQPMTYEDVVALSNESNGGTNEEVWDDSEILPDDEQMDDSDVWVEETNETVEGQIDQSNGGGSGDLGGISLAPLESCIELIGNRIFDKNRSAEIHDIQYIRLVWVDPGETLPDKNFVCFKYSDVVEALENTRWANRFNDAEDRNLREVFEQRMFTEFVINVSGTGARTLAESQYRSQQMLEFEHHLWNF